MTKDEALKLALEALEEPKEHIAKHRRLEAINAIKEALAQPEFVLNGIDCSCGRKWRVVNNTLTASEHPEQEPKKIPESLATHGSLWIESLFASPQSEQEKNGC